MTDVTNSDDIAPAGDDGATEISAGEGIDPGTPPAAAEAGDERTGLDEPSLLGGDAAVPAAYELVAPAGQGFDKAALAIAEPVLRDLGLSNAQAQKLVDVYPALIAHAGRQGQDALLGEVIAQRKAWADAAAQDDEIGGTRFAQSQALAAKAFDMLGVPRSFRDFLNETGLGNHAEMIRIFARVGKAVSEDGFARGDSAVQARKSDAELFYPSAIPRK